MSICQLRSQASLDNADNLTDAEPFLRNMAAITQAQI